MYSIQWLMKGIDERNRIGVPRDLLYAAYPTYIFIKLELAKTDCERIASMEKNNAVMKAIEMNGSLKRTKITIERALKYISCRFTRSRVDNVLNKMTIMQAELVTTYLGVTR